jgi:hypothetical protein
MRWNCFLVGSETMEQEQVFNGCLRNPLDVSTAVSIHNTAPKPFEAARCFILMYNTVHTHHSQRMIDAAAFR